MTVRMGIDLRTWSDLNCLLERAGGLGPSQMSIPKPVLSGARCSPLDKCGDFNFPWARWCRSAILSSRSPAPALLVDHGEPRSRSPRSLA